MLKRRIIRKNYNIKNIKKKYFKIIQLNNQKKELLKKYEYMFKNIPNSNIDNKNNDKTIEKKTVKSNFVKEKFGSDSVTITIKEGISDDKK